ncbi:hypothetical protein GCM10027431_26910 [Lysobacter rhizosphaerae]
MTTMKPATKKSSSRTASDRGSGTDPMAKGYASLLGRTAPGGEVAQKKRGRPTKDRPGDPVLRAAIVLHLFTEARQNGKTVRAARAQVVERALKEYGIRLSPTAVQRVTTGLQPSGEPLEWEQIDGSTPITGVLITEVDAETGEVRARIGHRPTYPRERKPSPSFDFRKRCAHR